jgi:hypothetical protein
VALVLTKALADFSAYTGSIEAFGGAGTVYKQRAADLPGRGTVLIDNDNCTAPRETEVPSSIYGVPGEADRAIFRVANAGWLRLTNNFTVRDIWLDTANARLDLGSRTLTVLTRQHALGPGSVVNYGAIVWIGDGSGTLLPVK